MSSELSAYKNFFDEFNRLAIKNSEKQFQEWQRFFDDYKLINQKLLKQKQPAISYDVANAENFFEDFSKLYNKWQSMGHNFNIFELASVKRDEVKITSILAWFLNPKASHGQNSLFLNAFLELIPEDTWSDNQKPLDFTNCHVLTECYGNDKSRMDIVIDTDSFYLVIEAKIDTEEHDEQLNRYKEIAITRAGKTKSWALIYLTVHGKDSKQCPEALFLTWYEIGETLNNKLAKLTSLPDNAPTHLVCEHFCQFICNL